MTQGNILGAYTFRKFMDCKNRLGKIVPELTDIIRPFDGQLELADAYSIFTNSQYYKCVIDFCEIRN